MNRRIVLVGFMGCGKTSVAKALAGRLDCDFIDLDTFITEITGRTPAEIIQQDGEPAFRSIETRALGDVLKRTEVQVIALGGGAWTVEANREAITDHNCLSIWLDASFELCWQRIKSGNTLRPLAPDRERSRMLYESRGHSYALASHRVQVSEADDVPSLIEKVLTFALS